MVRRISLLAIVVCLLAPRLVLGEGTPTSAVEQQIADATKSSRVTVVHFWAPWCPNCTSELANGGWSGFIAGNPDVNFVFVTIWNAADGRDVLEKNGVGAEKNFQLLLHPNPSRKRGEKVDELMGIPISWIPSTWVFKDGKLRYAMNFGELHFPMLQQLIVDSTEKWDR